MRRLRRFGIGMVLWPLAFAAALAASIVFHLALPISREVAAGWLETTASGEITGTLVIGGIEQWSLDGVTFEHVVLFDPAGHRIVRARRVTMVPDWSAILRGEVRFSSARLQGGVADLIDNGDGLPTLIDSFDSPGPADPDDDSPALRVEVDGIEIERLRMRGDLLGLSGIRARRIHARGKLVIDDEVHVTIEQARGRVVRPFGFEGIVDSLTGTISTVPTEGVDLFAATRRGDEHANAHVVYRAPSKGAPDELALRVDGDHVAPDTLRGLGFDWLPPLRQPVTGWASLKGPTEDLKLEAAMTSEAGDANIEGRLSEATGFSVTVRTDGMDLAEVLEDAPDLRARGLVTVEAAPDESEPRVHAEIEPLAFGDLKVPRLIVDGVFRGEGIVIEKLATEQRGGRITGRGRVDDDGALRFNLRAKIRNIQHDRNLAKLLPGAEGSLEAEVDVRAANMSSGRMGFSGRVVLRNVRYGLLSAERLVVSGSARGDPERPALNLKVKGTGVRFGEYALGNALLGVTGGPRKYTAQGAFEAGGKRTFNVDATIAAEKGGFVIDADPIEVVVSTSSWRGALRGLRVVGQEVIELELLRLANRSQRLEAHGIVRMDGEDRIEASLQDFDLQALHAILGDRFPVSEGRADASVMLTGDVERPELQIQGALRSGKVLDIEEVHALYLVDYANGRLNLDGEVDLGERGMLRLGGEGDLDATIADPLEALRTGRYDLELLADSLTLAMIPQLHSSGVQGHVSAELDVTGTLERPTIVGKVELTPLQIPDWGDFVILSDTRYDAGQLSARVSVGDGGGPLLTGNAMLGIDLAKALQDPRAWQDAFAQGPWSLNGHTVRRALQDMPGSIALRWPYPIAVATSLDLRKQGGASSGSVEFDLEMTEPLDGADCAEDVEAQASGRIELEGGMSRVDANVTMGGQRVARVKGLAETPFDSWLAGAPVRDPNIFHASADLSIAKMERFPFLCEYGSGRVSGELELDGGLASEPLLVAQLHGGFLPRVLRPSGARTRVRGETCADDPMALDLSFSADRSELKLSGTLQGCHGGASTLTGTLPVSWDAMHVLPVPDRQRNMNLLARFDSAQLKPLLDQVPGVINAHGIAEGRIELKGTLDKLQASGNLSIRSGELYLIATGQRLTGIDTELDFLGSLARIQRLQARAGDGALSSTGSLQFRGLWPERMQLGVSLNEFPVQQEGVDLAWLDGAAAIDARIEPERTRAAIKVHELTVRLPDSSDRSLQPLERHPDVLVVTQDEPEAADPYPIELAIDATRPFRVRRNDFDMTIGAELALAYMDPDLNVGGQVTMQKGEFEILGKRFDIENGSMRFDGTSVVNPEILLVARHQPLTLGSAPVGVSVGGTLADPEITFSSDECPGDQNAAAYLVSGQCDVDDPLAAAEAEDAESAFAAGLAGSIGGLATLIARSELGGFGPRVAVESAGGGDARVKAGVVTESLVPRFMRPLVNRVYVQGAISTDFQSDDPAAGSAPAAEQTGAVPDFLIELYFPHNLVGSGKFAPGQSWGLDLTWEP